MTSIQRVLWRPRSLFLWRANFQVHLWAGLILTLYLIVIGVTGSILVFRLELERLSGVRPWPRAAAEHSKLLPDQVVSLVRTAYPGTRVLNITVPTRDDPWFSLTVQSFRERLTVHVDPESASVLPVHSPHRSWLDFIADLHTTFLAGRHGRLINGVGAVLLLAINITGLVIWWPGLKLWRRGLSVDWNRSWRRLNYDLHRAVGFWALALLSVWAISGIYFGWPGQVIAFINRLSPLVSAQPPAVTLKRLVKLPPVAPGLPALIANAQRADPGTTLAGVSFPYSRRAPYEILMRRAQGPGREYTDIVYLDPRDGSHLQTWRYGVNGSLGDWFLWLQIPMHFGTYWGWGVKLIWAATGLALPLLAVSGVLMYWNRVLRHLPARLPARAPR